MRQHKPNLPRASTSPLPLVLPRYYIGDTVTDDLTTKPTLDTLMDMMRGLRDGMATLEERLTQTLEERLTKVMDERLARTEARLQVRFDRMESEVKLTHSELYALRADFAELKAQLKEHLPALK